jgi:hypothetical protein
MSPLGRTSELVAAEGVISDDRGGSSESSGLIITCGDMATLKTASFLHQCAEEILLRSTTPRQRDSRLLGTASLDRLTLAAHFGELLLSSFLSRLGVALIPRAPSKPKHAQRSRRVRRALRVNFSP